MSRSLLRRVVAIGASSVFAAIVLAPLAASSSPVGPWEPDYLKPDSDGWVHYVNSPVTEPEGVNTLQLETLVRGTVTPESGCTVEFAVPDWPEQYERITFDEVAFHPDDCASRVVKTYFREMGSPGNPGGTQDTSSAPATPEDADVADTGDNARAVTRSGYARGWHTDPVGLTVNSARNDTTWTSTSGGCVTSANGSYDQDWLSGSGWSRETHDWNNVYNCSRSESSSYIYFRNNIFCATIDTHVYYDRNYVYGRAGGVLSPGSTTRKSGGCNQLLSKHTDFGYN